MLVRNLRCDICGEDYEDEIPCEVPFAYEPEALILPYNRESDKAICQKKFRDVCINCRIPIADFIDKKWKGELSEEEKAKLRLG
jgi:hypothetical protein